MNHADASTLSSSFLPPQSALGPYTVIKVLGHGGFGITYLVHDERLECDCVLKENMPRLFCERNPRTMEITALPDPHAENGYQWALERFKDEAKTLAGLSHPNIVRVRDLFDALGTAYYVMDYIDGQELHHATETRRDEATLQHLLRRLLCALRYLHGKGILHRDIKPSNVLVTAESEPVLIDFGTARPLARITDPTQIKSGGYTPLEQLQTQGKLGPWSDLYALGATFYHVLTGECPPDCIDRIGEDCYTPLSQNPTWTAAYSPALLSSIDKALQPLPRHRWQSAEEWLTALETNITTASPRPAAAREKGNLLDLLSEVEQRIQQSPVLPQRRTATPAYTTPILPQTDTPAKPVTETAEEEEDELYRRCRELVIAEGKASTSLLQRRCSIGYGRAALIMDKLERHGIIAPANGSTARPRKVCISPDTPH